MRATLLCNAGLALEYDGNLLLIDLPTEHFPPFSALKSEVWAKIFSKTAPFDRVSGLFFTHCHTDHFHAAQVHDYQTRWPDTPVFLPQDHPDHGTLIWGPFCISYEQIEHAPMNEPTPPHVVVWIRAGDKTLYIAGDAKLDVNAHQHFLKGRKANAAFWNSMYLSRPDTRMLMNYTGQRNYIYHMPMERPDGHGLWKKLELNFRRYGDELQSVTVLDQIPTTIEL